MLADALAQARKSDSQADAPSESERPARPSVMPAPYDRRSMPHRERHTAPRESLSGEVRQPHHHGRPQSEPPPRAYTQEVKRANLLIDEFGNDLPPPPSLSIPPAPLTGSMSGRNNLSPGISERRSMPPNSFDNAPSTTRRSLNPFSSLKSLIPGAPRDEQPEEDPRYVHAVQLRKQNRKLEAMLALEELRRMKPDYPHARDLLFQLAVELGAEDRVRQHADWVLTQQGKLEPHVVCATYRSLRMACPNLGLSEKALVVVLVAADKARDGRAAVDVTKLLLRDHPASPLLPRAFMSSAQVQLAEGRPDLARATLESLIARFPHDSLAVLARKKLNELA